MAFLILVLGTDGLLANGLYRNGVGSRAMGMGGADVGWAEGPLGSMAANPAGLAGLDTPAMELSLRAAAPHGRFVDGAGRGGSLESDVVFAPDFAFGLPLNPERSAAVGISVVPDVAVDARWNYVDPDGGADGSTSVDNATRTLTVDGQGADGQFYRLAADMVLKIEDVSSGAGGTIDLRVSE
jgi:hypothetical protein